MILSNDTFRDVPVVFVPLILDSRTSHENVDFRNAVDRISKRKTIFSRTYTRESDNRVAIDIK